MMSSIAERAALALAGTAAVLLGACVPAPRVQCDFTPLAMGQEVVPTGPRLVPMTLGTTMEVPLNTVPVIDPEIASRVMVQSVSASRNPAGNVAVAARIVNCTDWPMQVQGRTRFFDDALRSAEPASAWQRLNLPPRSFANYGEVSVSGPAAGRFLIELRGGY